MRLSIIVPVFNAEKYLRPCLDSLVNQEMTDYEIVVVNDGSTDSSPEIIEGFQKAYPDLIRVFTVENGGQARARNLALENVQGDYIGFTDSDDVAHADMFPKLCRAAERENADMQYVTAGAYNLRKEYISLRAQRKRAFLPPDLYGIRFSAGKA